VAGLLLAARVLVIVDSLRVGIGWADDGPRSGYFPFYIGLRCCCVRGWTACCAAEGAGARPPAFADAAQLRLVLAVLAWPMAVYVGADRAAGHLRLVGAADRLVHAAPRPLRPGRLTAAVAVGVPLFFFLVFERWFLVRCPRVRSRRLLGL
jgi:putative tricarboxylic transport membrane protein